MIKTIDKKFDYTSLYGREVDLELFNKKKGITSAQVILENDFRNSHWWDDFLDFSRKEAIADNYELWYGKPFIKAQNNLKYMLENAD